MIKKYLNIQTFWSRYSWKEIDKITWWCLGERSSRLWYNQSITQRKAKHDRGTVCCTHHTTCDSNSSAGWGSQRFAKKGHSALVAAWPWLFFQKWEKGCLWWQAWTRICGWVQEIIHLSISWMFRRSQCRSGCTGQS